MSVESKFLRSTAGTPYRICRFPRKHGFCNAVWQTPGLTCNGRGFHCNRLSASAGSSHFAEALFECEVSIITPWQLGATAGCSARCGSELQGSLQYLICKINFS